MRWWWMAVPRAGCAWLIVEAGCLQAPPASVDANPCPPAENCIIDGTTGHTYAMFGQYVPWDDAVSRCEQIGWHLATDQSEEESALIMGLMEGPMWLGASDRAVDDEWRWITGEPFDYTHWRGSEPNGAENENCLAANWGQQGWNDLDCAQTWAYVCEIEPP